MKYKTLTLLLTACGTDAKDPVYETTLPASFQEGMIMTTGATLGEGDCVSVWPKSMPYEVDGAGNYHSGMKTFPALEGKDKTWAYQGVRVNGYLPVTVFTLNDESVTVSLKCWFKEPTGVLSKFPPVVTGH